MKKQKKIIGKGAEATIYLKDDKIIKERIPKKYRHPEIDKKLIKRRTKAEKKIMLKASEIINIPKPKENKSENEIIMPFINGEKLSEYLDSYTQKKQERIMHQLGKSIAKIHVSGIIHGDITTSNMILKNNELFLIDFGLAFQNGKYEDKGVDLHLLKQALEAKHFKNWEILFKEFEKGYTSIEPRESQKVFDKMKAIEKRGRYRH
jgi:TP53 regulating kinase and related kinases